MLRESFSKKVLKVNDLFNNKEILILRLAIIHDDDSTVEPLQVFFALVIIVLFLFTHGDTSLAPYIYIFFTFFFWMVSVSLPI